MFISNSKLSHLAEKALRSSERLDHLLALGTVAGHDGILNEQLFQVFSLVNLLHEHVLGHGLRLVDKKCHDGFGHKICGVLFDDSEVGRDQVLDHARLHDDTARLLVWVAAQFHGH